MWGFSLKTQQLCSVNEGLQSLPELQSNGEITILIATCSRVSSPNVGWLLFQSCVNGCEGVQALTRDF